MPILDYDDEYRWFAPVNTLTGDGTQGPTPAYGKYARGTAELVGRTVEIALHAFEIEHGRQPNIKLRPIVEVQLHETGVTATVYEAPENNT